jgi:regulator of nucleoside diphosphate kinase
MMQTQTAAPNRPPILIAEDEADTLSNLAMAPANRAKLASRMLLEEIERAAFCPGSDVPQDVVTMMSRVRFVDEATGASHEVQLVYPADADTGMNRINILTPVGAGLIGLRKGQCIDWPNRSGQLRRLRIVDVVRGDPAQA